MNKEIIRETLDKELLSQLKGKMTASEVFNVSDALTEKVAATIGQRVPVSPETRGPSLYSIESRLS